VAGSPRGRVSNMIGMKVKKKKVKKEERPDGAGGGEGAAAERKTAAELRVIRDTEMDFKHLPSQLISLYLPNPVCREKAGRERVLLASQPPSLGAGPVQWCGALL
jgi:hypothetical protein